MMSGRHIYELRQRLATTQEEFARLIGVTVSTVNRWENGHNTPSRLARLVMQQLASPPPPIKIVKRTRNTRSRRREPRLTRVLLLPRYPPHR